MDEIMAEQKQQEELQKENEVLDKKQLKAAKKLEKKKRKQKNPDDLDGDEETVGGKILVFFVTIIIILIWLAIFAMLIKLDVGGFGSGVLAPVIKDVPYLNKILPDSVTEEVSTEDSQYAYTNLDDAINRIKELEIELADAQNSANSDADYIAQLEEKAKELDTYKQNEADFEKEKEKWYEKLKAQGQSITVPMTLLMIAVAVIPLLLQTWILIGSFKQNQIEARSIEIQNQCVILSNRMTRSGYMTADKANNVSLDAQMQTIADLYNGRIVIVNSSYKIMTDTFNLSTGKYYISEEVIRCFKGESGGSFNKEGGYFYQTIPVYDPADEKKIQGVIAVTASMENVVSVTERVKSSAQLFFLCMALVAILFSIMSAHFLVRPFKRLLRSFDRVAQGDLDADISEDAYSETRQMSQAVQKSLRKLKAVDQSRQEFVSNVSHELKTPITSIRVLADSLMGMEDAPVELYREFMADISD